jgi:hypothetical protein
MIIEAVMIIGVKVGNSNRYSSRADLRLLLYEIITDIDIAAEQSRSPTPSV